MIGVAAALVAELLSACDDVRILATSREPPPKMADLDLRAGRTGDAAAHVREALHLAARTGNGGDLVDGLYLCGNLCAATGRAAEA